MMRAAGGLAAMALLAAAGQAAVLRGTVVESQTGKALARSLVVVQPVAGGGGATQSVRTNENGVFQFPPMAAGAYLVTVSRLAFAAVQYGQRSWKASGVPVMLQEDHETNLHIALPRYGAIVGRVVDENDVGLPEHEVFAYRNTRPPVAVAKAITDDRGVYRIGGLEPGAYVVRTAAKQYDDGGYLPTFFHDVPVVESARPVEAVLDLDVPDIVIRPMPGRLYTVGGAIYAAGSGRTPITVKLVSDMGSDAVSTDANGRYRFQPVAPGRYELFAEAPGGRYQETTAAFRAIEIERDQTDTNLTMRPEPSVQFVFEDTKGAAVDSASIQVLARQKQLSGQGETQFLRLVNNRRKFSPGRWEFALAPNYAFYLAGFVGPGGGTRSAGWNETLLNEGDATVKFVLSLSPGAVHGVVTNAAHEKVAGAPVFLEPYDAERRRRIGDLRSTRTDVHGEFQFAGLAPGSYRVASTFEFRTPDAGNLDAAGAATVQVAEGVDTAAEVVLYGAR